MMNTLLSARCWRMGALLGLLLGGLAALAGAPFTTDDPDTLRQDQWQLFLATTASHEGDGRKGTLPQMEVEYGYTDRTMLHLMLPYAYQHPANEPITRGVGDTEVGVLVQLQAEAAGRLAMGFFPKLQLPTGSTAHGLGSGHVKAILPVFVQKSWGPWTIYGGGGYHRNPGAGNRDFWQVGAVALRAVSPRLSLGGELFTLTPTTTDDDRILNVTLGGQYTVGADQYLLFSAGRSLHGDVHSRYYLGYQVEFGGA